MYNYRIENTIYRRLQNKYIVLTHMLNTYEKGTHIPPHVYSGSNNKLTWDEWQYYFYRTLGKDELPVHYFMELAGNDYIACIGNAEVNKSYFIDSLATIGAVPRRYSDAIVIGIGTDFRYKSMEDRLSIQLCDKILSSLVTRFRIDLSNIVYLDDILLPGWASTLDEYNLKYDIQSQKLFNMADIQKYMRKYNKSVARGTSREYINI